MNEEVVHYYNVITGRIACGVDPRQEPQPKFSVFEMQVSCSACLKNKPAQNPETGKSKAA